MQQNPASNDHVLGEMQTKMDKTRQEWEDEVSKLKWDFFNLNPNQRISDCGGKNDVLGSLDPSEIFVDTGVARKTFRVTFDVSQFNPDEISVRTQDNKLIVYAKHEEVDKGRNVSREFSRQIDVPKYVDPNTLKSILGKDGILVIEAPVIAREESQENQAKVQHNSLPPLNITGGRGGWSSGTPSPGVLSSGTPSPGGPRPGTIYTEKDGTRKLKMIVEVGSEFNPEDVAVKTVDRKLHISAKREEKKDSRVTKKEYSKELELPDEVDANAVAASMTLDGKLIIEAPISSFIQGSYQGKPGSTKQPEMTATFQWTGQFGKDTLFLVLIKFIELKSRRRDVCCWK